MIDGFTIWLTGLPGSGKTTLAHALEDRLLERGLSVERLDGEEIRSEWLPKLGGSREEQAGFDRFLGHLCKLFNRNGVIAVCASRSPSSAIRKELRSEIDGFIEVHVSCPRELCVGRTTSKDSGSAPWPTPGQPDRQGGGYEEPAAPEVLLKTHEVLPEACCLEVLKTLEVLGFIPRVETADYSVEDEARITENLRDLGYL